jgi:hypothetical protein
MVRQLYRTKIYSIKSSTKRTALERQKQISEAQLDKNKDLVTPKTKTKIKKYLG